MDAYFESLLIGPDKALEAARREADEAGLPPISVSATQGRLLQLLALAVGARTILEIGTLGGYSAIWLARGLASGGRLTTLELEPGYAAVAERNLERAGLSDRVDVVVGRAQETLGSLRGPFDLIFIDADKRSYPEYLEASLALSRPGTLILADNVVRNGAVLDADGDDPDVEGVRRFNEMLARTENVLATGLQTVGIKGYDGLAFALVTS